MSDEKKGSDAKGKKTKKIDVQEADEGDSSSNELTSKSPLVPGTEEKKKEVKKDDPVELREVKDVISDSTSEEEEKSAKGKKRRSTMEVDAVSRERGERVRHSLKNRVLKRKSLRHEPRWNVYPTVFPNRPEKNEAKGFPSNEITTTKYTFWNFIPKNLFEQFRRATNFYFLLIIIITFIPIISPLTPITSILPLAFVLGVTAIKEAYEDWNRFKADRIVNNRKYTLLLSDGTKKSVPSKDLKVGDVLYLQKNDIFPADIILLSTGLPEGECFIETAQLDGESNLKTLKALPQTCEFTEEQIQKLEAKVDCEEPHQKLYTFFANITFDERTYSLGTKQLLLRGAKLRNTPWAFGIIVYAGKDTKLSLNQKATPSKFSRVEKKMNKLVLGIFIFKMSFALICGIIAGVFQTTTAKNFWYLGEVSTESGAIVGIKNFFAYFVLLSFLIPMSMMVTLEVVKVVQAKMMEWDPQMMLDPNDPETSMKAKTSNLNDELAMVSYVFSDKTGTLTENKMVFSKCSIDGVVYNNPIKGELGDLLKVHNWKYGDTNERESGDVNLKAVSDFLLNLAINHTVVAEIDHETKEIQYQAQSPDEAALCSAAKINSIIFRAREKGGCILDIQGQEVNFELLNVLEFSSDRARMSVVVRNPEGKIIVFAKGADGVMFKRLNKKSKKLAEKTKKHIDKFSQLGLRTLILAQKEMSQEEYDAWAAEYHEASTSLKDRDEKVEVVNSKLEQNFDLVGCTAIEDRLQEGVPDTIDYLLRAGIKVWIITGDKQETAINIGYSTKLLKEEQTKIIVNVKEDDDDKSESCRSVLEKAIQEHVDVKEKKDLGIIIDGATLDFALKDHPLLFYKLASNCNSVVCCRVTPLQKSQVVKLVKEQTGLVCLSIGDGANDVSMIQEAHIGIGIFGKEGTQAARAADYCLQQFKHLKPLLTVHGRYCLVRNSQCIQASLYKNLAFFFVQFWFALTHGASSQTAYDDWIVTAFNITITSLPPFALGFMEKDVSEKLIHENPRVYKYMQSGKYFTGLAVFGWMISAFYHSGVSFLSCWLLFQNDVITSDGKVSGQWIFALLLATCGVCTILGKIGLETKYWTKVNSVCHFLCFFGYVVLLILISSFLTGWPQGYFTLFESVQSASWWLCLIISTSIALIPDITFKFLRRNLFPKDYEILQESASLKFFFSSQEDETPQNDLKVEELEMS